MTNNLPFSLRFLFPHNLATSFENIFLTRGYTWYDSELPYNINIFGIRNPNGELNKFDDSLYLVARDEDLKWFVKHYPITTRPGITEIKAPSNSKGVAILVPGQYKGAYKLDFHNGKYLALCQRNKKVSVYRDNNKDYTIDYDPSTIESGFFGINIHKSGIQSTTVDNWSAGCQVFSKESDFNDFISIVRKSAELYGNSFTYTLL